jgi:hypothetical protein
MEEWESVMDSNLPRHGAGFKRGGFLGEIPVGDSIATEYSIGVPINGQETEIPSIVPSLDSDQIKRLIASIKSGEQPPEDVVNSATQHAQVRMATGQSPFAGDNESPSPTRHAGPWKDEYVHPGTQPAAMLNMLIRSFNVGK